LTLSRTQRRPQHLSAAASGETPDQRPAPGTHRDADPEHANGDVALADKSRARSAQTYFRHGKPIDFQPLRDRAAPGRTPYLTEAQMAELRALVLKGPDPEKDKVVRWRCVDLLAEVKRRFSVEVHESTIGKWLRELGLTRLQPRPVHPKKDPAAEAAFKKTSPAW
jgi:transposase